MSSRLLPPLTCRLIFDHDYLSKILPHFPLRHSCHPNQRFRLPLQTSYSLPKRSIAILTTPTHLPLHQARHHPFLCAAPRPHSIDRIFYDIFNKFEWAQALKKSSHAIIDFTMSHQKPRAMFMEASHIRTPTPQTQHLQPAGTSKLTWVASQEWQPTCVTQPCMCNT